MNVLCIAQQSSLWKLHGAHEQCILKGLQCRGVDIDYFVCNGVNRLCGLHERTNPDMCERCYQATSQSASLLNLPMRPLYGDETRGMAALAGKWVGSLDPGHLADAEFMTYPLGRWMLSSLMTAFRLFEYIPAQDEAVDCVFKHLLRDACLNLLRIKDIFDGKSYDSVLLFNNRIMASHIVFQLARLRGISVYSHERGLVTESLCLIKNLPIIDPQAVVDLHTLWKDLPLAEDQLEKIRTYFMRRERGDTAVLNWDSFSELGALPPELGRIAEEKLIWSVFPSSTDEIDAEIWFKNSGYASQHQWLQDLIGEAAKFPGAHLIIRAHPNLASTPSSKGSPEERRWYAELAAEHKNKPNLTIIQPHDTASSYAIMNISDAGFAFLSTCGLELAAKGIPTALGHNPHYACSGCAIRADSPALLAGACAEFARRPKGWRDYEAQRQAFRFAYTYVYRWSLPMPLVLMPTPHVGHLAGFEQARFMPGATPELDRIVTWIINDEEPMLRPDPATGPADAGRETAWLRSLQERELAGPAFLSHRPAVSVVMCVYNGAKYLRESVTSILNQTFEDFEFIIVDDASTDGSAAILASFTDPRLKIIRNERNMERACSRNLAIEQASTPLIAIMDADDFSLPERLEKEAALMKAEPETVWCSSYIAIYESDVLHRYPCENDGIRIFLLADNCMPHSAWMARKKAMLQLRGYNHRYIPSEDYHLLARASLRKGWRFRNIPEILLRYRDYPGEDRQAYRMKQLECANAVRRLLLYSLLPDIKENDLPAHLVFCGILRPANTMSATARARLLGWGDALLKANRQKNIYDQHLFEAWISALHQHLLENLAGKNV